MVVHVPPGEHGESLHKQVLEESRAKLEAMKV